MAAIHSVDQEDDGDNTATSREQGKREHFVAYSAVTGARRQFADNDSHDAPKEFGNQYMRWCVRRFFTHYYVVLALFMATIFDAIIIAFELFVIEGNILINHHHLHGLGHMSHGNTDDGLNILVRHARPAASLRQLEEENSHDSNGKSSYLNDDPLAREEAQRRRASGVALPPAPVGGASFDRDADPDHHTHDVLRSDVFEFIKAGDPYPGDPSMSSAKEVSSLNRIELVEHDPYLLSIVKLTAFAMFIEGIEVQSKMILVFFEVVILFKLYAEGPRAFFGLAHHGHQGRPSACPIHIHFWFELIDFFLLPVLLTLMFGGLVESSMGMQIFVGVARVTRGVGALATVAEAKLTNEYHIADLEAEIAELSGGPGDAVSTQASSDSSDS